MKQTTNHSQIKQWILNHNGKPVIMDDPKAGADEPGLRVDFPGKADEALLTDRDAEVRVDWQTFFETFDRQGLAFEYEEDPLVSPKTLAYKFIKRDHPKNGPQIRQHQKTINEFQNRET